ncbi:TIGR02680 family protein [Rubrivivax gelatinosus]|nr:TIGR02680 family protein [Rubrivivax gelatinosus]
MDTDIDLVPRPADALKLPEPQLLRWQPLRMGVVELFYYDSEEFWFTNGHLVLRGNNGTGKSKVLSLTMPLLLDAEVKTSRVEPDADSSKKMSWNLLVGSYERRIGYTWIEFGRIEDGAPKYLMLGAGLSAGAAKPKVDSWFFLVEGGADSPRVNRDFWLTTPERSVLPEKRLKELVNGKIGQVFETAEAYRRAVDERLFMLGRTRYSALMDTLIQLRRPHLSERPDETKLSNALSESLPPIASDLLIDVAEALGRLEDDRLQLEIYERLSGAVDHFEKRYRVYATTQTRRQAKLLRQAQTDWDNASRESRQAVEALQGAQQLEASTAEIHRAAELALSGAHAALEVLLENPAMHDAASLERLRANAEARSRDLSTAEGSAERQRLLVTKEEEHSKSQLQRVDRCLANASKSRGEALAQAVGAGLDSPFEASPIYATPVAELIHIEPKSWEQAQVALKRTVSSRKEGIALMRRHFAQVASFDAAVKAKTDLLDVARDELELAVERRVDADDEFDQQGAAHVDAWDRHVSRLRELRLDSEELFAVLGDWVLALDGSHPAASLLRQAHGVASRVYADSRSQINLQVQDAQTQVTKLRAERMELKSGVDPVPPSPYTRAADSRVDRAGAPLWKLIDFNADVPAEDRAGIESALEGAGLLDAWVNADGSLDVSSDRLDTRLQPRAKVASPLTDWLRASCPDGSPVSAQTVERLLCGIACGADDGTAEAWIGADGRFRLSGLAGRWHKSVATYVGYSARAEARAARLQAIEVELTALGEVLDQMSQQLLALGQREALAEEEVSTAPQDAKLRQAFAQARACAADVDQRRLKVQGLEAAVSDAKKTADVARQAMAKDADDLRLPKTADEIALVANALDTFNEVLVHLLATLRDYLQAWPDYQVQLEREQGTREELERLAGELAIAQEQAANASAEYEILKARVGPQVEDMLQQVTSARQNVKDCQKAADTAGKKAAAAATAKAVAETTAGTAELTLTARTQERSQSVITLQKFVLTGIFSAGLPDVALPDLATSWTIDPALTLARRAEGLLADVDDSDPTWNRIQRSVGDDLTALQGSLSALGYQCTGELTDFGQVVTVTYQNRQERPDRLAALLKDEVQQRKDLLTAKEREVLENHLQAEIASSVQRLLKAADQHVVDINEELEKRPTSTGVKFRLVWEPLSEEEGGPVGLLAARQRLLHTSSDLWSMEDRKVVGAMLQERVKAERERAEASSGPDVGASLAEQLAKALDYRRWHRFRVERWQDKNWRKLSGPASSGERALGLTVPLFAAVASFYGKDKSGVAPRLMLLDEAFAGIDDAARAHLMALIREFDLDFIITSEREWGCYAALPGVSICQLQRRPGVDAVFVSRWTWDGKAKKLMDDPDQRFPPSSR